MAGLLLNVLAPGTQVRTAGFAGAGFAEAVVKSFILAAMEWIRWLDVPLLCLLALLVLPLLHLIPQRRAFRTGCSAIRGSARRSPS